MKQIKQLLLSMLLITFLSLIGCAQNKTQESAKSSKKPEGLTEINKGVLPDTLSLSPDSLNSSIEKHQQQELLKAESEHVKEALDAIKGTKDAIKALDAGKKNKAIAVLEKVDGKLDLILARYPEAKMIPVDASVEIINLAADINDVKNAREDVEDLIDDGYLQDARQILDELVSEIRVTTVYFPMETYPDAIKKTAKLLDEGKEKEAKSALQVALSTLVANERIVPIPVINAETMIEAAILVADTAKVNAQKLLKESQYQLDLANELGYGKHDKGYDELEKEINSVNEKLENGKGEKGFLDSLKSHLRQFKSKITG